jgi:carboxylesterase type B
MKTASFSMLWFQFQYSTERMHTKIEVKGEREGVVQLAVSSILHERNDGSGFWLMKSAPVLVWIYGGGYVEGSKVYNPAGLISQSQKNGGEGFIFVAINYRLGMFGWLSGPTFQKSGTANAGLYDQRLALEWVQKYIHLFGGDPKRVTVAGESAGGGSIMHQITAYGGLKGKVPFQQALPQSPAWQGITSNAQKEDIFNEVLQYASLISNTSVTSLSQLRSLPSSILQTVNAAVVGLSTYGTFTFGPAVDGKFVPALPGLLLLHGQFDRDIKLLIGHNSNESLLFTSPFVTNETALRAYLEGALPAASDNVLNYIENVLYPPVFNGTYSYTNEMTRLSLAIAESTFTCNTRYLDLAFNNQTYSYYFNIPPGLHGEDVAYTFFNGDTSTPDEGPPVNATVATMFQSYISNFVVSGNPNGNDGKAKLPYFSFYGEGSVTLDIDSLGDGKTQKDELANGRCEWWQKALYD